MRFYVLYVVLMRVLCYVCLTRFIDLFVLVSFLMFCCVFFIVVFVGLCLCV